MTATTRIIRSEEVDAFARWEVPAVEALPTSETAATELPMEDVAVSGPTVRELEELQKAAYDEGFAQGRAEGHAAGHAEGHAEGLSAGRETGLAEGRAEGYAAGEQEARELVGRMRQIFDTLAEPVRELDDSVEQALTSLALSIAQQIIRRELALQPGEVVTVLREALALLPLSAREVSVRLHPDDVRFIRDTVSADEACRWTLIEDPTISRGGCRVLTSSSQIDATLEHRIAVLASELLGGTREGAEGAA